MIHLRTFLLVLKRALWRDPKRFTWMVIGLFASNPLPFYQLMLAILHMSWGALLLVPIAFGVGHFWINLGLMRDRAKHALVLLQTIAFFEEHKVSGYSVPTKSLLSRIGTFSYDIGEDIEKWLFQSGGTLRMPLNYLVNTYIAPGIGSYTAYTSGPALSSRLFLSNEPKRKPREAFQKFLLLHEVMHCVAEIKFQILFRYYALIFFTALIWLAPLMPLNFAGLAIFICFTASFLLIQWRTKLMRMRESLEKEIEADNMAIGYLDIEEATIVRRLLNREGCLKDPQFSDSQNNVRLETIKLALDRCIAGQFEPMADETKHLKADQWSQVPLLLTMILAAWFTNPLSGWFFWFALAVGMGSFMMFFIAFMFQQILQNQVNEHLAQIFPLKPDAEVLAA
jgi:ABC-type multidrug transport system fused ATPase/permease subunit